MFMRSAAFAAMAFFASQGAFAQQPNWTGFYVGASATLGWSDVTVDGDVNDAAFGPEYTAFFERNIDSSFDLDGFGGGVKGGANYQFGQIVLGAEVSYDWLEVDGSRSSGLLIAGPGLIEDFTFTDSAKIEDLFTVRARAGIAVEYAFIYLTGGYASAEVKRSQAIIGT